MDLLLSCVSENQPRWFQRVRDLVLSVRLFGGSASDARFIVNFVGDAQSEYRVELGRLGAEVRVVEGVDPRFPLANKLRMFELHEVADFDVLVGLDCDLVVVEDFSGHVPATSIGAKAADYDLFTDREWRRLYGAAGLRPPAKGLRATTSGKAVGPYFNTGVVTVPSECCGELRRRWGECHGTLMSLLAREPDSVRPRLHSYVWDQVALALALAHGRLPWIALPVAMNFPCHVPVHRSALQASPAPMVLHHHGRLDPDGFLLRPRCGAAAEAADRFNSSRAVHLSLTYRGLRRAQAWSTFWRARRNVPRRALARSLPRWVAASVRDLLGSRLRAFPRRHGG